MADDERKEPTPAQERKSAEERVREAEDALSEAREELAESQSGLRAVKVRDVPQMVVRVLPNVHVQHEGKDYHGEEYGIRYDSDGAPQKDRMTHGKDHGTELTLDGPTAIALVMEGQVQIVRSLAPGEKL